MQDFGLGEVRRILGVPATLLRLLIRQRYVTPARDRRRAYRFSFQDLIVLRAARDLLSARVPPRRLARALKDLRRHLPGTLPPAGLAIRAVGERVVVQDRRGEWDSASGQYLLAFDVAVKRGDVLLLSPTVTRAPAAPAPAATSTESEGTDGADAEALFATALARESADARSATRLYRRCLALDPAHRAARVNLARLLQEAGQRAGAERLYRHPACRADPVAMFNLGVLYEDAARPADAIESYLAAVALDPSLADAHYNLARLYELQGKSAQTLRHLLALRRLERVR